MISRLVYLLALSGILLMAAAARLGDLSADAPLNADRDFSLSTDGAWYAGAALDRARGRTEVGVETYDRPIHTALVRAAAWFVGPGMPATALVAALSALVAIALTASAARRMKGPLAGLLAAGILASDYAFLVYSRSPNIYTTAALLTALVLWCFAQQKNEGGQGWFGTALVWGIALSGVVFLKSILTLLLLPLLSVLRPSLGLKRLLLPRRVLGFLLLLLLLLLLGLGLFLSWKAGWLYPQFHKIRQYFLVGPGGYVGEEHHLLWRVFTLELRTGLISMSPVLGVFAFLRLLFPERPAPPSEKLAARYLLLSLAVMALLVYSPIRYLIPVYPAMAILAASGVVDLLAWARGKGAISHPSRFLPGRLLRVSLGGFFLVQVSLAWTGALSEGALFSLAVLSFGLALALELMVGLGRWLHPGRALQRGLVALFLVLVFVQAFRGGVALAHPRYSLSSAGRELEAMLPPAAHLTGPFAHALTYESHFRRTYVPDLRFGKGILGRTMRGKGFTHLLMDISKDSQSVLAAFRSDGAELEPLWEFTVRGTRVGLFRFPWSDELCPPSDFERGVAALRNGNRSDALRHLQRALDYHPRFAAAATALGVSLLEEGKTHEAVKVLVDAFQWNPYELRAARALVGVYMEMGDHEGARSLLQVIASHDPRDTEAVRLAERLGRRER